jgi:hypothetical protein
MGLLAVGTGQALAGVSWSVSIFDGPLGQCGHWVERPNYGRCWYPAYVSSDWRPYCEGYWMWTDDGWYWVSNEDWAWATYHYGRWVYDSYYGWVWTPDTEWGPSWVCWREGGGYVGWAPLPPGAAFGPEGGVVFERPVQDRFFVFVEVNHFSEPIHRHAVIVNKTTVINKTVNITKITRVNNVIVNHGPKFEDVQKVSTRKLTEPVPRAAKPRDTEPRTFKPGVVEQPHQPLNEEKSGKHEPEVIHGTTATPSASPGVTRQHETEKKEPERPRVEPLPTESRPVPAEKTAGPRKEEITPPSKPPHEERAVEKRTEPRQEERKEEKPQKAGQGGD